MDIKEKIENAPNESGTYLIKDREGNVIYVGKASSLKNRLKSHFIKGKYGKEGALVGNAYDVDYILTPDEPTALLLEASLIKRYNPKYNVALRDDKSYPRLKLTINEEYPRLYITRRIKDDNAAYFGPYTNAKLLRKALMFMKKLFPLRTCQAIPKKPCLNFHIGQCPAPCVNKEIGREYLNTVEELKLFLNGEREGLVKSLAEQMKVAADNKEYERAAKIRDRIKALSLVTAGAGQIIDLGMEVFGEADTSIPAPAQLEELRAVLNLPKMPVVIEAFDISNISGKEATGSVISFKNGKPDTNRYRRFSIKTVKVIDDYSMMREIVSRRYNRLLAENQGLPDLIIIDGGKGHLLAAKQELNKLGLWNIPVISIAKGVDNIYVSKDKEPIRLGKFTAALLLIQRIRDEAHRFAIGYHRLLRQKKVGASELDNIEGIGAKRKVYLIRHFGSLDEVRMADIEDLKKVKFISGKEARAIYDYFHKSR